MADEERLIVALEARIRDFERNMKKAERTGTKSYTRLRRDSRLATTGMERDMLRSTTRINTALASTSARIGALGKAFAAGAIAAGITALTRASTQAIRSLADLGREADRAGVSVEAFQELRFVSEQSRIGINAMIDGLKEMQLRADEFVVTGKGPAAEAFQRLGFSADELGDALEDPKELLLDLIDRMEDLDRAGQIRVADEVFGGTAGERFVELLDEGDEGIRQMIQRARDMGVVMDEGAVRKAEELDRKFAEITARVETLAKRLVVNLAGAIDEALSVDVDDIFGSAERAIAMMGEEAYRALKDVEQLTDAQRQSAESLADAYGILAQELRTVARSLDNEVAGLIEAGFEEAAVDLAGITDEMRSLVTEFEAGRISAEEFETGIEAAEERARGLADELAEVDGQTFASVIAGIGGIGAALTRALEAARDLRGELPGQPEEGDLSYGPSRRPNNAPPSPNAPRSSPRPRAAPPTASLLPPTDTGGTAGAGGGAPPVDPLASIREEIEEQERLRKEIGMTEAAVIGFRAEQEALAQAKKQGIEVTDDLRAAIGEEAAALERTARAAIEAERRQEAMVDLQRDLAEGVADWAMGLGDAEQALRSLARQLIVFGVQAALHGLAPGTFEMPTFGGRAAGGPASAGTPYVVNERTANSEVFVPSRSGGVLTVPQAQAALRDSVQPGAIPPPVVNVPVNIITSHGVEPQVRRQPSGRVDVDFRKAIGELITGGGADRAMRSRYGISPIAKG